MDVTKKKIENRLSRIESQLNHWKRIMNVSELSAYIGMTESYIYKLSSSKKIPHYRPLGKLIYFDRNEIDEWILSNKVTSLYDDQTLSKIKSQLIRKR